MSFAIAGKRQTPLAVTGVSCMPESDAWTGSYAVRKRMCLLRKSKYRLQNATEGVLVDGAGYRWYGMTPSFSTLQHSTRPPTKHES